MRTMLPVMLAAMAAASCADGANPAPVPEPPPEVSVSAPSHASGPTVAVQVVAPPDVERVDLAVDGAIVVELVPPYTWLWPVTSSSEGPHVLVARASRHGRVGLSAPRTVVIDRTSPTVVSRSPAPGSEAWALAPIEIRFSEPIAPGSIPARPLELSGPGAPVTPLQPPTLSADGRTLTMIVPVVSTPPTSIAMALAPGITDLAGNAVVSPGTWTLFYPEWISVAVAAEPASAIVPFPCGAIGFQRLAVGYFIGTGGRVDARVAWRDLGAWKTAAVEASPAFGALLATTLDQVFVAAQHPHELSVSVQRIDASGAVTTLGSHIPGCCPAIAIDGTGAAPLLATSAPAEVTLWRWDGSSWTAVGPPLAAGPASHLSLAPGARAPTVLWTGEGPGGPLYRVSRLAGGQWEPFGDPQPSGAYPPQLAVDQNGRPILAHYVEGRARLLRWNGTAFEVWFDEPSLVPPSFAPTYGGRFWVGYHHPGSPRMDFQLLDPGGAQAPENLPGSLDLGGLTWQQGSIAVDGFGFPAVAWLGVGADGLQTLLVWQKNVP